MRYEIHAEMSLVNLRTSASDTAFGIDCHHSIFLLSRQAVVSRFLRSLLEVRIPMWHPVDKAKVANVYQSQIEGFIQC